MTEHDAAALPDLEPLSQSDRLDAIIETIGRAESEGVLSPLPTSRSEVRSSALVAGRIVTVRTRLHLLGYLKDDSGRPEIDQLMRDALRRFQADAGLVVDGWFGEQTWSALEQLVDFESDARMNEWTARPEAAKALSRALRLRLHVLGLLGSRTVRSERRIDEALARFSTVAWMLGVTHGRLEPKPTAATLSVLFDLDRISSRLARGDGRLDLRVPPEMTAREAVREARRFVVCVSTIELWLLGLELELDGQGKLATPRGPHYAARRYPLYHALVCFWRSRGRSQIEAESMARSIDLNLFLELRAIDLEEPSQALPLESEQVYNQIESLDASGRESVWDHMQRLGSRLWDGVKRVWRWIRSIFKRIAQGIRDLVEWTKNLARLAYRYAMTSFGAAIRAVKGTVSAIRFLLSTPFEGSDPDHLVISRDRDLDLTLVLDHSRDPAVASALTGALLRHGRAFRAGIHLLSRLVSLVIKVVASVTGAGWLGLILALVRLFRELRQLAGTELTDPEILAASTG